MACCFLKCRPDCSGLLSSCFTLIIASLSVASSCSGSAEAFAPIYSLPDWSLWDTGVQSRSWTIFGCEDSLQPRGTRLTPRSVPYVPGYSVLPEEATLVEPFTLKHRLSSDGQQKAPRLRLRLEQIILNIPIHQSLSATIYSLCSTKA